MNRLIIFISGFVGGVAAGLYAGSKLEREKCDDELKMAYKTYENAMKKADEDKQAAIKQAAADKEDREVFADALRRLGYSAEQRPPVTIDYSKVAKVVMPTDDHPRDDEEYHQSDPGLLEIPTEEEFRREDNLRNRPPEVIAETVFAEDYTEGYDQQELLWYPKDRIMLDACTNELIDDPYAFLGLEWENDIDINSQFSIKGESYVRNYRWNTDYFILEQNGSGLSNMSIPMEGSDES